MFSLLTSCEKDLDISSENEHTATVNTENRTGQTISLGETIAMPYSLKNVQAAYDSLCAMENRASEVLKPTHYYVRFLPKDSAEYATLLTDTSLMLTETPWDRITEGEGGEFYHDPSLSRNSITWQYTKVPVDYTFTDVEHEILDEMYILPEFELTEENSFENIDNSNINTPFGRAKHLQAAALYRAGYVAESAPSTEFIGTRSFFSKIGSAFKSLFRSIDPTWTPKATIKAWDDLLGRYIPLKGVKVLINHGGIWVSRTTDSDGYVSFPKCVGPVIYKIEWSDTYWQIFDGYIFPAYYSRSGTNRSTWNLNISSGKSLHYACIHRAARRHLYENNCGIDRPYHFQKICYLNSEGTGEYWANMTAYAGGYIPDIKIYGYENGKYKTTYKIFETAAHELGHAQHCLGMGRINFWQVSKIIYESWADCVAWALTNQEYGELNATKEQREFLESKISTQTRWPEDKKDKSYSPLFVDLVDNFNQRTKYGNVNYPDDRISGYTMYRLNQILKKSYGLSSLKANLKSSSKPTGVTNANIDLLFKRYEEVWQ